MNVEQLYQTLVEAGEAAVRFQLPSGQLIPDHFHVTEVGRVDKDFIDCGGTRRKASSCLLQTWTADDVEHRLAASKLARILKLASPVLGSDDLPIEVEYGPKVAAQYIVGDVVSSSQAVTFVLNGKQTDCLAKDQCGVGGCSPSSGCC